MYIRIDSHVHCRDEEQAYKTTIQKVLELARQQGVGKIVDMPNPKRPVTTRERVEERLRLVPPSREGDYFLFIGATPDERQLEEAVACVDGIPEVLGIKMFAGKSVGDLEITEPGQHRSVYRTLARLGYEGHFPVHCEEESEMRPKLWKPYDPFTHSLARPKQAEIVSVRNQVQYAMEEGFRGNLHICHISCPEAVELVNRARGRIRITCGVTPHHLMWDNTRLREKDGLGYKMNPPLRGPEDVLALRADVKAGRIDWVETDHARHSLEEKFGPPYLSGYPSLELYRGFVEEFLPRELGLTPAQIRAMTRDNIVRVLGDL